tara:strand:+ start:370 stop:744 length:375 start_codon:yes stop_codon:yes gene_type:complete
MRDGFPRYTETTTTDYGNALEAEATVVDKAQTRKATPIYSGVIKYFPNAIAEVAKCSKAGNDQHHPDKPLHWDMSKSSDELDALVRHLTDHSVDPVDDDGVLHLAKVAWRALAALERFKQGEDI